MTGLVFFAFFLNLIRILCDNNNEVRMLLIISGGNCIHVGGGSHLYLNCLR